MYSAYRALEEQGSIKISIFCADLSKNELRDHIGAVKIGQLNKLGRLCSFFQDGSLLLASTRCDVSDVLLLKSPASACQGRQVIFTAKPA